MKINRIIAVLLVMALGGIASGVVAQNCYSLEQLRARARQNNHAIAQSQRNIDVAVLQRKEAFTKFFPSISASALTFDASKGMASMNVNPAEIVPSSLMPTLQATLPAEVLVSLGSPVNITMLKNGTIAGLTLMQPVYAGGQIINGNRLAQLGEDVSNLQLMLTQKDVDLKTEQYYWQLISLQQKTTTLQTVETLLAGIHNDVEAAVSAGVAMRNDLLQVELRQNELEGQKLKLSNGTYVIKLLLNQHCGLNDTTFTVQVPSLAIEPVPFVRADEALPRLPEYQLLNKQVEASELNKKMVRGKLLPTVAVGAGLNYHNLLDNNRAFAMVFATVSVPISDWWGGSHALKRSEQQRLNALDQLVEKSELLSIRMQQSWNELNEARLQISIAQRGIEQASENLRVMRDYYNAGINKMSDLLEAQLLYQQALDSLTDAFVAYQMKSLQYKQATAQN